MIIRRGQLMRCLRITLNATMYALMLYLTCFPLLRGLWNHGVVGFVFLALVLVHQGLNWRWYASLTRGRWNYLRTLYAAAVAALLTDFSILTVSSLVMAGEIFPFMPFAMTSWARDLHALSTAWLFVLVSFHLGLHLDRFLGWLRRILRWGYASVFVPAMAVWGAAALLHSRLWADLLLLEEQRTFPETIGGFLAQYLGITVLCCLLARLCVEPAQHYYRRRAAAARQRAAAAPAAMRSVPSA